MRILGIDPGTATTGYGVIDRDATGYKLVDYGCILTPPDKEMPKRLEMIYQGIGELIDTFKPDEMAIEELFFNRNITTAITVGQARGVLLLGASQKGIKIAEYTPLQVKQAIAGYGKADKKQVQFMIKTMLKLKDVPKPDDAADALAIAICHSNWLASRSWNNGGK